MTLLTRIILLATFMQYSIVVSAQLIKNPSFEGVPLESRPPEHWQNCNQFSTPDTQPGAWFVDTPPSHGSTYISLITRGNLGPYANFNEATEIELNKKLKFNKTYQMSVDLAFSKTFGHDTDFSFLTYDNPVKLIVWGGKSNCDKTEVLWTSPAVDHTEWRTYDFEFTPLTQDLKFLIIEAEHIKSPTYFGNVLIDNLVERDLEPEPDLPICSLQAPNVITPNNDGENDIFLLFPNSNIVRFDLKIYNRWGKLVFETKNINDSWTGYTGGDLCSTGVYFWHAQFMCLEDNQIYDNVAKGALTVLR